MVYLVVAQRRFSGKVKYEYLMFIACAGVLRLRGADGRGSLGVKVELEDSPRK